MKNLYVFFSIFFILFFPKMITDVICYGRHRDRENIKSRKVKGIIYLFWVFVFSVLCLIMGAVSRTNNTFDRFLDFYGLYFEGNDYFEAGSSIHDESHKDDFVLVYYIKKNENNIEELLKQIIEENNSIYKRYQLSNIEVIYKTKGVYYVYEGKEMIARITTKNEGLLAKVTYYWSRKQLEQNKGG